MARELRFGIKQVHHVDQRAFVFSVQLLPKYVANFCDCTDQFAYGLIGSPRRQVSHDAAHINNDRFQFGY